MNTDQSDLVFAVYDFLQKNGHSSTCKSLLKESKINTDSNKRNGSCDLHQIFTRHNKRINNHVDSLEEVKSKKPKSFAMSNLQYKYILAPMVHMKFLLILYYDTRLVCFSYTTRLERQNYLFDYYAVNMGYNWLILQ